MTTQIRSTFINTVGIFFLLVSSSGSIAPKFENNLRRDRRDVSNSCEIPEPSLDKIITFDCKGRQSTSCGLKNGYVPEFTVASIKCKPNYHRKIVTYPTYICNDKTWTPKFDNCLKKCDKLNPVNVELKCSSNGKNITCDENSLLSGSKVRPSCKLYHKYRDIIPDYIEITCKEDGKWDKPLFSCVPECGKPFKDAIKLIQGGKNENISESPWHVAIYDPEKILICSGTIIHPYLVLTAAHCFNEGDAVITDVTKYEVVVSKVSRDYLTIDNHNQKAYKIKQLHFSNKRYYGLNDYHASDIVALILEEIIKFSPTVMPACINWIGLNTNKYVAEGTLGKVSGWGLNDRGDYSETLMTTNLPFISRARCLDIVSQDYKAFITFDKFCAGTKNGSSVQRGDSGGGLLFQEGQIYFLRGIVSLKQPTKSKNSIAAFTDLADHKEWIFALSNEMENKMTQQMKNATKVSSGENICKEYGVSNCTRIDDCLIADTLISTKIAIYCGQDIDDTERICCSLDNSPPVNTKQIFSSVVKNSTAVALAYCEKYSQHATDCVHDAPPDGERKRALLKEYPHIAYIGCETDEENWLWNCVGSLISEKFIMSVSYCCERDKTENPKWAFLGHLNHATVKRDARDKIYYIENQYYQMDHSTKHYSLALYQLKIPVTINSNIRPACLYTSDFNQFNNKLRIVNWGIDKIYVQIIASRAVNPLHTSRIEFSSYIVTIVEKKKYTFHVKGDKSIIGIQFYCFIVGSASARLLKGSVTVINDQLCSTTYRNVFDSNSSVCAGNTTDGEALCLLRAGSPLQISMTGKKSCMWSIYAILSGYDRLPKSCGNVGNADPYIYRKVSYYIDWIQRIVWPDG